MKGNEMTPQWIMVLIFFVAALAGGAVWFFISHKQYHSALWIGFFIVVAVLLNVTLYIRNEIVQREIQAKTPIFYGELVPGNEPTPAPFPAGVPQDTVALQLGDDLRVLAAHSENYIFSKAGEKFLSIGVNAEGTMVISAEVMDSTNNNIVRIINNEFQANPQYAFNPKQPDKHSLVVRDSQGVEVLNVRFINPKVIRVVGRFHIPGYTDPILILPDEGIRWPGGGGIGHLTMNLTQSKGGFINFK